MCNVRSVRKIFVFVFQYPFNFGRLVDEVEANAAVYVEPDVSPYILLAARSFLAECSSCPGTYRSAARRLYKRLRKALKSQGVGEGVV